MKHYLAFIIAAVAAVVLLFCQCSRTSSSILTIEVRRTGGNETIFLVDRCHTPARDLVGVISSRLEGVPTYVDDLGTHPDMEIRIVGDPHIEYGALYPVIEACRECGIHLVTFVCADKSTQILIFDPCDLLRGPENMGAIITSHPPKIKLLWYKRNSNDQTDSPDGRFVVKIKTEVFETQREELQPEPDYEGLRKHLQALAGNFLPPRSYHALMVEMWAHWNVPFGAVVRCADIADECEMVDSFISLPWRWQDLDWDRTYEEAKSDPRYQKYRRQVGLVSRGRIQWNYLSFEGYEDKETGHYIEYHKAVKENLLGQLFMYLDSRDSRRRKLGARLLKSYFGNDFGYRADAARTERAKAVSRVKIWWQENKPNLLFDATDNRFVPKNKGR